MTSLQADTNSSQPVAAPPGVIPGIENLPVELLDAIFEELLHSNCASLAGCVLVCRVWSQIAYPHRISKVACIVMPSGRTLMDESNWDLNFKHRCEIPKKATLGELASFLKTTPQVAKLAKSLFLCSTDTFGGCPSLTITTTCDIVTHLPSLSSLEISGFRVNYHLWDSESITDDSFKFIRKSLRHLSIRRMTYYSEGLEALLGLFSCIDCLEATETVLEGQDRYIARDNKLLMPVRSLVVIPKHRSDYELLVLPKALGEPFQESTLQSLDIIANYILYPGRLSEFIQLHGRSLRSVKLGRLLSHNSRDFTDVSPCFELDNLSIIVVMPCFEPPSEPDIFPPFLEHTWPSALQTILGASSTLRTLSIGVRLGSCEAMWGNMLDDFEDSDPDNNSLDVIGRLRRLDWIQLERVIEERPMLQEVHIRIDAAEIKDSPVVAALEADVEEVIHMECFKSQKTRRVLQVSVTTAEP